MSENNEVTVTTPSESETRRPKPIIFGCAGIRVSAAERALLREADPFGIILFKRNCEGPDQVRYLIEELRQICNRDDLVIAIDQEGGRVSRLQPPRWPKYPSARRFGEMYERDPEWGLEAIRVYSRIIANELSRLGIGINCAPVLDLFNPNGTPALGDRCYSSNPAAVAALAKAQAETFLANGVLPVIKHMPGHGRLKSDPHLELPVIDADAATLEASDFQPFIQLKDMPLAMNSHAILRAFDAHNPASLSSAVNVDVIRGKIGFGGLLFSDDISMKALNGIPAGLARKALDSGNDVVLHCNAVASEMASIGLALDPMKDEVWARWEQAKARVKPADPAYLPHEDAERLDVLLGGLEIAF